MGRKCPAIWMRYQRINFCPRWRTLSAAVPFIVLIIAIRVLNWSPRGSLADGESKMEPELIMKQFDSVFLKKKKKSTIEVIQKTRTQGKPRSKLLFCYLASSASAQGKKVWRKVRKRACFKAECSRTPTFILLWLHAFADSAFIIKKFHRRKPVSVAACVPASIICIWLETRWH